jgi:hypothetical protein
MGKSTEATAAAMGNVKQSTADTATAMNAAKNSFVTLAADQDKSLDHLKQMNSALRASLMQTNTMASTLQTQLGIFQTVQSDRLAQLARKPKLVVFWGDDVEITRPNYDFPPISETDTSVTFQFNLHNYGNATASRLRLQIAALGGNGHALIEISPPLKPTIRGDSYVALDFDFLRPGRLIVIFMTLTFPRGQAPFYLSFNADADEIEPTYLGQITVHPRNPVDP